jgi:2-keto-4-pentenoate hydratase/2-oxohepta-3-ene-1,7-dioic acid hydratase in catechol pathway
MRLCNFLSDGTLRPAVLSDPGTLIDLAAADPALAADPRALLSGDRIARLAAVAAQAPETARIPLAGVTLAAPVPRPEKIICIGLNYRDHAEETGEPLPSRPTVFAKFPNALTGPYAPIVIPEASSAVDYEAELGVVIGRRARAVPEAEALSVVGGYLAFNDVSARDVQHWSSQWTLGKTFDSFAPAGPFLVTADEVPDPQKLAIETRVNGVTRQHSSTANMIFTVARLIAILSSVMTLEPGDIIATGTPGGIGAAQDPPRFLAGGDVVEVDIEGIGCLRNPVVAASRQER